MPINSTETLDLDAIHRTPAPAATVHVRHLPDGTVTATSRGLTGSGRDEDEALWDLGEKFRAAPPG